MFRTSYSFTDNSPVNCTRAVIHALNNVYFADGGGREEFDLSLSPTRKKGSGGVELIEAERARDAAWNKRA